MLESSLKRDRHDDAGCHARSLTQDPVEHGTCVPGFVATKMSD